jgi:hypothetical protein
MTNPWKRVSPRPNGVRAKSPHLPPSLIPARKGTGKFNLDGPVDSKRMTPRPPSKESFPELSRVRGQQNVRGKLMTHQKTILSKRTRSTGGRERLESPPTARLTAPPCALR